MRKQHTKTTKKCGRDGSVESKKTEYRTRANHGKQIRTYLGKQKQRGKLKRDSIKSKPKDLGTDIIVDLITFLLSYDTADFMKTVPSLYTI